MTIRTLNLFDFLSDMRTSADRFELLLSNIRHINYKMAKHHTGWRCRVADDDSVVMLRGGRYTNDRRVIADGRLTVQEQLDALAVEFSKPEWGDANVMIIARIG